MELQLINEALFKENSPLQSNTNITEFVPYILLVQKMYIKPVLGASLYETLQKAIKGATEDPAVPIAPELQALIIEIAPALSFYAVYQGLPFHWAKIQNKGITVLSSDNSKELNVNDLAQVRRWIRDDAQTHLTNLKAFLGGCDLYPTYAPETLCGKPEQRLDTGFYIPRRRRK